MKLGKIKNRLSFSEPSSQKLLFDLDTLFSYPHQSKFEFLLEVYLTSLLFVSIPFLSPTDIHNYRRYKDFVIVNFKIHSNLYIMRSGNMTHIKGVNMSQKTVDLELTELPYFTGTDQYYRVLGTLVTDGIKYIMDNGYSWFVSDALAVIICKRRIRKQRFLTVELRMRNCKKSMANLVITDGNNNVLYRQTYAYTNAKQELKLYFENGVMMLPSER